MIITTTQEYALVAACCDCHPPSCEAPRKKCESMTISPCGFAFPSLDIIPESERCKRFAKLQINYSYVDDVSGYEDGSGSIQNYNRSEYYTCTKEPTYDGTDCSFEITATTLSESSSNVISYEGEETTNETSSTVSSSSSTSACSGTSTFTDAINPENNYTEEYNVCPCIEITHNEDSTFSESTVTLFEFINVNEYETITINGASIYSELIDEAYVKEKLDELVWDEVETKGTECQSKITNIDFYPDPPEDPAPEGPIEPICTRISSGTKARYKMGIPATAQWDAVTDAWTEWDEGGREGEEPEKTSFDVAHAAWVIAKAAWDAADPETRGPEPAEPTKRTFFQIQWDEVQFPSAWDAWRALKDAFDIATAAHEVWEAEDPETRGPEPEVPEDPGDAPTPGPTVIASRSWSYAGGDDFSPWYELEVMEVEGETRVVNVMTKCYQSARLGSLPTAHGEIYEAE
jgi:hypothetical protein